MLIKLRVRKSLLFFSKTISNNRYSLLAKIKRNNKSYKVKFLKQLQLTNTSIRSLWIDLNK